MKVKSVNEDLLVPKKERKRLLRLFKKEFLPTISVTYEEYAASDQLTKKAINEAFRAWLRKRTGERR